MIRRGLTARLRRLLSAPPSRSNPAMPENAWFPAQRRLVHPLWPGFPEATRAAARPGSAPRCTPAPARLPNHRTADRGGARRTATRGLSMTAGFATATTPDPKQRIHCSLSARQGGLPVPPRDSEGPYSASETPAVTATLPIEPRSARKRLVSGPAAPRPPSLPRLPEATRTAARPGSAPRCTPAPARLPNHRTADRGGARRTATAASR